MSLRFFSTLAAAGPSPQPPQLKTSASLALFSARVDSQHEKSYQSGQLCALSWMSTVSYARLPDGTGGLLTKSITSKHIVANRASIFRCATIEEIEAEKTIIEKDVRERMEKTTETIRSNFNAVRTGRANPAMLDGIEVEYYGTPVTLKSIAQISTPDASSLLVQPFDKSSLKAIEKAIVTSDVGLTPNNDGEVIRLVIPQLTSERRKDLSKLVAKQAEEGKVAIRNIRRDAIKAYEKLEKILVAMMFLVARLGWGHPKARFKWMLKSREKKLSEDNVKDLSSDLQKVTDEYMKKIDSLLKQKEKELLTV